MTTGMVDIRNLSTSDILLEIFELGWDRNKVRLERGHDGDHGTIFVEDRPYLSFKRTPGGNYMYYLMDPMPHRINNIVSDHCRYIDQLVRIRLDHPRLFSTPERVEPPSSQPTCSCMNGCKSATCDKL